MSAPENNSPWPEGILDIPFQDDLGLDTHGTHGEHATKEYGSWQQFTAALENSEQAFPEAIDDPFAYYIQLGPGRFHRAYNGYGSDMLVGMTTSPADLYGGRQVDTLLTGPDPSLTATAVREILVRNVFGEFAGIKPMPASKYLEVPSGLADQNLGIKRALYDFAVAHDGGFTIPMPNIVTPTLENLDEAKLEGVREDMPAGFHGILRYFFADSPDALIEEFYRGATYLGKEVTTYDPPRRPTIAGFDAAGEPVELGNPELRSTEGRVHFLKTLAERDPELIELIVAA